MRKLPFLVLVSPIPWNWFWIATNETCLRVCRRSNKTLVTVYVISNLEKNIKFLSFCFHFFKTVQKCKNVELDFQPKPDFAKLNYFRLSQKNFNFYFPVVFFESNDIQIFFLCYAKTNILELVVKHRIIFDFTVAQNLIFCANAASFRKVRLLVTEPEKRFATSSCNFILHTYFQSRKYEASHDRNFVSHLLGLWTEDSMSAKTFFSKCFSKWKTQCLWWNCKVLWDQN